MKQLIFFSLLAFMMGACSQQKQAPNPETDEQVETLEIENGWVRPGNAGMMTAAYFTINNGTEDADTLMSIRSTVAEDTQIHESFESGDGMMGMREIGMVPVGANSFAELKPGGIHIMVIRPSVDIVEGDSIDFVLQFSNYGELELRLPVRTATN